MNASIDQLYQALLDGPAMDPPPGVNSNLIDPPNLNRGVIVAMTLYMTCATLVFLMRLYTKLFLVRKVVFEDYTVTLGWLLGIATGVTSALIIRHGGGVHQWNVQLKTFFDMLYWTNVASIIYGPTLLFIKLSILLQYIRIFVPNRQANLTMWIVCHVFIGVIVVYYVIDSSFNIWMCRPREKYWNPLQTGSCYDWNASLLGTGLFNAISDFCLLILPMRSIWKLHVPMRKKLGILAVFATGTLACIVSTVRTYYTFKLAGSDDVTYYVVLMGFWTQAEVAIGIMISCFPVLPRLFKIFRSQMSSFSSKLKATMGMTGSGTSDFKSTFSSARHKRGKKGSDGFIDLNDLPSEGREKKSPFQREDLTASERHLNPPALTRDHSAPQREDINDEQLRSHILKTTQIETDVEAQATATNVSYPAMSREQERW